VHFLTDSFSLEDVYNILQLKIALDCCVSAMQICLLPSLLPMYIVLISYWYKARFEISACLGCLEL